MNTISEKVLRLTTNYLGPASQRFLERQTRSHMHGLDFAEIKEEHLPELFKWIELSARLIINDKAEEMVKKMEALFNVKRTERVKFAFIAQEKTK